MNGFAAKYSSLTALAALAMATAAAAQAPAPGPSATKAAIADAERTAAYPSFASIPPMPKDLRSLKAWKASVTTTQAEGAKLAREAAAEPWTLGDTNGWADRERSQAVPPPPITSPSAGDTEAFAAAMRARATPPPRKR
jgi:hypothetical protein